MGDPCSTGHCCDWQEKPDRIHPLFSFLWPVGSLWCGSVRREWWCVLVWASPHAPWQSPGESVAEFGGFSHTRLMGEDTTCSLPSPPQRHHIVWSCSCTDAVWVFVDDDYGGWLSHRQPSFCQGGGRTRERCTTLQGDHLLFRFLSEWALSLSLSRA